MWVAYLVAKLSRPVPMCHTVSNCLLMIFIAHISPIGVGYNSGRVRHKIRAQMYFSHTNYSPQISAFTWIIRVDLVCATHFHTRVQLLLFGTLSLLLLRIFCWRVRDNLACGTWMSQFAAIYCRIWWTAAGRAAAGRAGAVMISTDNLAWGTWRSQQLGLLSYIVGSGGQQLVGQELWWSVHCYKW